MDGIFTKKRSFLENIMIIGMTNRLECIDPAILRPGRLEKLVHIQKPNLQERLEIIQGYLDKMPHKISNEEMKELAYEWDSCSSAEIHFKLREAALSLFRNHSQLDSNLDSLYLSMSLFNK